MANPVDDYEILEAMTVYGGSFASALAGAFGRADSENYSRLKTAFPELWDEYRELVLARRERLASESDEGRA